jgi:hypothetical protein
VVGVAVGIRSLSEDEQETWILESFCYEIEKRVTHQFQLSLFPIVYEKMIAVEKLSGGDAVEEKRDVFTYDLDVDAQTSAGDG